MKYRDLKYKRRETKLLIQKQEMVLKENYRQLKDSLQPPRLKNQVVDYLISDPSIVIKAGMLIFSVLKWRRKRRKNKRSDN